ncbi:HET-domain-containing protein [Microthyrium microscopicum]|uniref:HET-domain-containing protein n=1 Tax=Microthyrium microscopicum TaxID=703497 RepID=A0A6A6UU93_9PEZI|nr:HET-domain-containing protein [Microthyrium microscopicum]
MTVDKVECRQSSCEGEAGDEYRYVPLTSDNSTRIVCLAPALDHNDPLRCSLSEIDVHHPPEYQALSYVWGIESERSSIQCGRQLVSITQNLDVALRHFRGTNEAKLLWVDSISINQRNIPERNKQVVIMGTIYRQATEVLVWLGRDNEYEETAAAIDMMNKLVKGLTSKEEEYMNQMRLQTKSTGMALLNLDIRMEFGIPEPGSKSFDALQDLFTRPWFYRAWTFQESFLASRKTYWIGSRSLSPGHIFNVQRLLMTLFVATEDARYLSAKCLDENMAFTSQNEWIATNGNNNKLTLSSLLAQRRGSKCGNPSDLVYSLLGIASDGADILPDYDESYGSVFAATTMHIIQHSNTLAILSEIDASTSSELPSWVPDWRHRRPHAGFVWSGFPHTSLYRATGSTGAKATLSKDSMQLTIQGIRCGVVEYVQPWDVEVFKNDSHYVLLQILQADVSEFSSLPVRWNSEDRELLNQKNADEMVTYILRLLEWKHGCKYFCTKNGLLGNANSSAMVGDIVVLLNGGQVPYLIRKSEMTGKFSFVGDCYVHNYMDGQGFIEARKKADPTYDDHDRSWLQGLEDAEIMPFPVETFNII